MTPLSFARLAFLTSTLLMGVAVPSRADELTLTSITTETQRRTFLIRAAGTAPLKDGARLEGWLQRQGRRGPSAAATVSDGAFTLNLSLRGLVLPGAYELVVAAAREQPEWVGELSVTPARRPLTLGDPGEREAADARVRGWLERAAESLTATALTMERRAAWHRALIEDQPDARRANLDHAAGFRGSTGPGSGLQDALRTAALDLALYERRLVLAPYPNALAALNALRDLIASRAEAQAQALEAIATGQPTPALDLQPYKVLTDTIAEALELEPAHLSGAWALGPTAIPERGELLDGRYLSAALGFSLEVPEGWRLSPNQRAPSDAGSGRDGQLRAELRPEAEALAGGFGQLSLIADPGGDLLTRTSISGWEQYQSYKRIQLTRLADGRDGVRHEFLAQLPGKEAAIAVQVTELRLRRPDGTLLILALVAPYDRAEAFRADFEAIAESLTSGS